MTCEGGDIEPANALWSITMDPVVTSTMYALTIVQRTAIVLQVPSS